MTTDSRLFTYIDRKIEHGKMVRIIWRKDTYGN